MKTDFDQNIDALIKKFHNARTDFISQIGEWRNDYRKAVIAANLQENVIIKEFVKRLFDDIEGINYRLQNERSDKLTPFERDRLLDKRSLYEEFIYIFVSAKEKVESIEKVVKSNL